MTKTTPNTINRFLAICTAVFCYLLTAASILFVAYVELHPRLIVSPSDKLIYAGIITCTLVLASRLMISVCRTSKQKRRVCRICIGILFLYYILVLANMLFFDIYFSRGGEGIAGDWRHFYDFTVNLVPLKTINLYVNAYINESLSRSVIIQNLVGNVFAFAPMGFFLPILFHRLKRIFLYVPVILLMVSAVEGIQLVAGVGSCDVDDIILNFAGALLIFLICKLPPVKKCLQGMYL